PEGRIIKRDVEAVVGKAGEARKPAAAGAPARPAVLPRAGAPDEVMRITQMRKAIARRLSQSKYSSPHFYLTMDVDMRQSDGFRKRLNELAEVQDRSRLSFNDLITKARALALRQHPMVNAS